MGGGWGVWFSHYFYPGENYNTPPALQYFRYKNTRIIRPPVNLHDDILGILYPRHPISVGIKVTEKSYHLHMILGCIKLLGKFYPLVIYYVTYNSPGKKIPPVLKYRRYKYPSKIVPPPSSITILEYFLPGSQFS